MINTHLTPATRAFILLMIIYISNNIFHLDMAAMVTDIGVKVNLVYIYRNIYMDQ